VAQPGAIVTGAAKRIGRALAYGLAERGFDIALHFNQSEKDAIEAKTHIEKMGRRCILLKADLSEAAQSLGLIKQAVQGLGQVDLLVNNASIFHQVSFLDTDQELFDKNIAVHLRAPFFMTSEFAKVCQRGNVINIIDTMISTRNQEYFAYLLSKKALLDFTEMAAKALAPKIRVNALAPGSTVEPIDEPNTNYLERRGRQVPLQLPGNPDYLLKGIDFCLNNPFVTGSCIFIDGGAHLEC
jgi:NAD(P)-dependent dehydrogenase (short-subunit alcohol dehydrogenase family)